MDPVLGCCSLCFCDSNYTVLCDNLMIRDRKEDKMASTKASHGVFSIKNGHFAGWYAVWGKIEKAVLPGCLPDRTACKHSSWVSISFCHLIKIFVGRMTFTTITIAMIDKNATTINQNSKAFRAACSFLYTTSSFPCESILVSIVFFSKQ